MQDQSKTKIRVHQLTKEFDISKNNRVQVLAPVNLDIKEGEFITLLGASGCGKTTLLRIIGGLEHATSGYVEIHTENSGVPVTSTVFQDISIFPWLDVQSNVEYGLKLRGVPKNERRRISSEFIDKVGLSSFKRAYPSQLSGGMKQRVSVARAFANGPEVLLMDEPFGALDEQTRIILQEELLRLWSEYKRNVIFVTHSIDEAIILADRVIVLSSRPGRIKADIPIDLPRPRSVADLRANPRYAELYVQIWDLIREEVQFNLKGKI